MKLSTAPRTLQTHQRVFLEHALDQLSLDPRLVGVAVGGSYLSDTMDEYSDLDLVIAVEPSRFEHVLAERKAIAVTLGPLVAASTGEHVGDPRLLICLYAGEPPLHVDLKFVALDDLTHRVEDPAVLWDRTGAMAQALTLGVAKFPAPDPQWIEDRFWIWVHYAATKVARGELFEAVDFLAFLRMAALGPLILAQAGARPMRVRKLEVAAPQQALALESTLSTYSRVDCWRAVVAAVEVYLELREHTPHVVCNAEAEKVACAYLERIKP